MIVGIEYPDAQTLRKRLRARLDKAQNLMTRNCKQAADIFTPGSGGLRDDIVWTRNSRGAADGWRHTRDYAAIVWRGVARNGGPLNLSVSNPLGRRRWTEHAAALEGRNIVRTVAEELTS